MSVENGGRENEARIERNRKRLPRIIKHHSRFEAYDF